MPARTSESDPIRVAWAPAPAPAERLGMTFAPGKKQPWSASGGWDRDLQVDLQRLRDLYRVDRLVSLVENKELTQLGIAELESVAALCDIAVTRFPIADWSVPASRALTRELVAEIVREIKEEHRVVVHCMGGLGRTGLITACVLVALGDSGDKAIAAVRSVRPGAVENPAQELFVREFAASS